MLVLLLKRRNRSQIKIKFRDQSVKNSSDFVENDHLNFPSGSNEVY